MSREMTSPLRAFHPRNAVTYAALLLGTSAVAAALLGHTSTAGAFVAVAVIADTFDGRFARLFPANELQPAIGVELDSLCDSCTFGMAPVICTAAISSGNSAAPWIWLAGFLYLFSAVTRLAFYNVTHASVRGFVGLPVPVAALVWSSALCFTSSPTVLATVLVAGAIAMVGPWPIPRPTGAGLLLFALWPLGVVVTSFR
jgi:CDP-diacylglycerol--serine O-phosphatidyltransferase